MIAVCALCDREVEVEPFGVLQVFMDLCDFCISGLPRKPLTINHLTPDEIRGLTMAGKIALSFMEDT